MRGGEKCVEALCEVYPDATLFVLLHNKGSVSPIIERMPIRTSWIGRASVCSVSGTVTIFRSFPLAIAVLRPERISISSSVPITALPRVFDVPPHALHICYCYTPMRYIWTQYEDYFDPERSGSADAAGDAAVREPAPGVGPCHGGEPAQVYRHLRKHPRPDPDDLPP